MKKRLVGILLTMTMIVSLFPIVVSSTEAEQENVQPETEAIYYEEAQTLSDDLLEQVSDDEHIEFNMTVQNIEVYVTDGYVPIEDAVVTVSDVTEVSDENGIAYLENISINEKALCNVQVYSDIFGAYERNFPVFCSEKNENGNYLF